MTKKKASVLQGKNTSQLERVEAFLNKNYEFCFNMLKKTIECKAKDSLLSFDYTGKDTDDKINDLYITLLKNGFNMSYNKLESLIRSSYISKPYDPLKNYLYSLRYDGKTDYIARLCEYIDCEETPTHQLYYHFKKWFVRLIRCMLDDKYFNKQVLVLVQEKQNGGKSSFCRWLCPPELYEYYTESNVEGKDEQQQLVSNFLICFDEMNKINKTNMDAFKALLSQKHVNIRMPFAKRQTLHTRRCSFIGNTNNTEFMTDETGSVRFLCFLINEINFDYSKKMNINDVYAQAFYLYENGYDGELTKQDVVNLQEYNRRFTAETNEAGLIFRYLKNPSAGNAYRLTSTDVVQLMHANFGSVRMNNVAIGKALKLAGFTKRCNATGQKFYEVGIKKEYLYVPVSIEEQAFNL